MVFTDTVVSDSILVRDLTWMSSLKANETLPKSDVYEQLLQLADLLRNATECLPKAYCCRLSSKRGFATGSDKRFGARTPLERISNESRSTCHRMTSVTRTRLHGDPLRTPHTEARAGSAAVNGEIAVRLLQTIEPASPGVSGAQPN